MKPKRDITGGTVLRIPAIQSPNFQSDVSGWQIAQDGSAQFNNVTLIGSIVLTASKTLLIYSSAAPATGTLVISLSPVAGSDLFGNSYPAGLAFYDGSENQIATLDPVNGLILNGHGGAQTVSLEDVPLYFESVTGTQPATPANLDDVTGWVFTGIPALRIQGPTMPAATDSKTSRTSVVLTGGNAADAAEGLLQFESTDSGGVITALTWTKTTVTIAFALVVTGKTTLNEQATINSSDVNGALRIAQSVPTTGNPGTISHEESAAGNGAYAVFVTGDAHARFVFDSNGRMRWGPGSAALDCFLQRTSVGLLEIQNDLTIDGELQVKPASTEDGLKVSGSANGQRLLWTVGTDATSMIHAAGVSGEGFDRVRWTADGALAIGPGTATRDTVVGRVSAGYFGVTTGDFGVTQVGHGLRVAEGANAKMGTAVLVGGTVVVSTTAVTANSRIFLTAQNTGGTPGALRVSARTAGTSFTITSTSASDTSTVAWHIMEPA